ncbi:MAG: hypothetical protein HS111_10655 [Kofleriaceae bacterium]|nr:hypothetical protein [Kofleriaceae bacterium]MCL4223269.1 hypothetical protein [Myxococcales bacterium]
MAYATIPGHLTRLTELDDAWATTGAGARLAAVRAAARRLHDRLTSGGPAVAVRTADVATFPYPTRFGLEGAARSIAPFVMMRNRVQLVQVKIGAELINVLVNPSDPERSLAAPFFAEQLARYGNFVSRRVMSQQHGTTASALAAWGVDPADIHYVTFDHLHVQDVRGLLGTIVPEPGQRQPTRALLPNARLLAQRSELATLEEPHPLQRHWYVAGGILGVDPQKLIALDGDYALGAGLALVRTPGHTIGNHSIAMVTDRGVWTVSENGVAVDAYAPEASAIAGLSGFARARGVEVILNANTREHTLDQYTSMVLEKTLADPCPDRPEFPQHFSSSELVRHPLAPGLGPTYSHGAITHGQLEGRRAAAPSSSRPSAQA